MINMRKLTTNKKILVASLITIGSLSAITGGVVAFCRLTNVNGSDDVASPSDAVSTPSDYIAEADTSTEIVTDSISELTTEVVCQPGGDDEIPPDDTATTEAAGTEEADSDTEDTTEGVTDETDTNGDGIGAGKYIPEDFFNEKMGLNYVPGQNNVAANPVVIPLDPAIVQTSPAACCTVDGAYFDDAAFIGNSRTEGLLIYSGVSGINLAYTGLNVVTAYTTNAIRVDGVKVPVMTALQSTTFSKAYIMFGVNEVGWMSVDTFISYYRSIIQDVKAVNPDAKIYVQSMLPVTAKFEAERGSITNEKIYMFNTYLKALADEQGVYFLNIVEAVADENGYLPANASWDGFHLTAEYCGIWYNYLLTHAVP